MNQYYRNNGFTLFEIIVGINIGFLLLTVIVTFFLFATKFISSTSKKLNERENINSFLSRLETTFNKSDNFYFQKLDSSFLFLVNNNDSISIKQNSFSLMNLFEINSITNYKLNISMKSGKIIIISNGKFEESEIRRDQNSIIYSSEISRIGIDILKNNHSYKFFYINPNISINRFRNITK